jgi:hypothetical protein
MKKPDLAIVLLIVLALAFAALLTLPLWVRPH